METYWGIEILLHAFKTYGGTEVLLDAFLTSALEGGEWSASHPAALSLGERATGAHWLGVWMGPRASTDTVGER
jgi:hypothetical protein